MTKTFGELVKEIESSNLIEIRGGYGNKLLYSSDKTESDLSVYVNLFNKSNHVQQDFKEVSSDSDKKDRILTLMTLKIKHSVILLVLKHINSDYIRERLVNVLFKDLEHKLTD